jgi:pilus assembly protein CpaC
MLMLIASCSAPAQKLLGLTVLVLGSAHLASAQDRTSPIVHKIQTTEERIEMTANTSRILNLNKKIPRAQVNNPDILDLIAIGPIQVLIHSRKPGITRVNLWDENNQIHAVDVVIYADVKELSNLLKSQFPKASVMVVPTSNSVILQGFADRRETVEKIMEISQDLYPRVINCMIIGDPVQVRRQSDNALQSENRTPILIPAGLGDISISTYNRLFRSSDNKKADMSSK